MLARVKAHRRELITPRLPSTAGARQGDGRRAVGRIRQRRGCGELRRRVATAHGRAQRGRARRPAHMDLPLPGFHVQNEFGVGVGMPNSLPRRKPLAESASALRPASRPPHPAVCLSRDAPLHVSPSPLVRPRPAPPLAALTPAVPLPPARPLAFALLSRVLDPLTFLAGSLLPLSFLPSALPAARSRSADFPGGQPSCRAASCRAASCRAAACRAASRRASTRSASYGSLLPA